MNAGSARARAQRGFTLAEVMIAVVLLGVGVMALAGSSAMVTRMVGRGGQSTLVGQVLSSRAERLRQIAAETTPPCGSANFASGNAVTSGITERWELLPAVGTGTSRQFRMTFTYKTPRGQRADTVLATVLCK